jgi:hypothetical protein
MSGAARRSTPRKEILLTTEISGVSGRMNSRILDLSDGGGFIDTRVQVQPGDRIRIAIWIDGTRYVYTAVVVHVQPDIGFGFAFQELTSESLEDLRCILADCASRSSAGRITGT